MHDSFLRFHLLYLVLRSTYHRQSRLAVRARSCCNTMQLVSRLSQLLATHCNTLLQHTVATHCKFAAPTPPLSALLLSSPAAAPGADAPCESLECFAVLCVAVLRVLQSCTFLPLMLISTRRARRDCLEVSCSLFLCKVEHKKQSTWFYSPRAPLDSQETPLVCCTML